MRIPGSPCGFPLAWRSGGSALLAEEREGRQLRGLWLCQPAALPLLCFLTTNSNNHAIGKNDYVQQAQAAAIFR